jgi:hypothetical protein
MQGLYKDFAQVKFGGDDGRVMLPNAAALDLPCIQG